MIAFGIVYLFFIQIAGAMVESTHVLDLMNTSLAVVPVLVLTSSAS